MWVFLIIIIEVHQPISNTHIHSITITQIIFLNKTTHIQTTLTDLHCCAFEFPQFPSRETIHENTNTQQIRTVTCVWQYCVFIYVVTWNQSVIINTCTYTMLIIVCLTTPNITIAVHRANKKCIKLQRPDRQKTSKCLRKGNSKVCQKIHNSSSVVVQNNNLQQYQYIQLLQATLKTINIGTSSSGNWQAHNTF